MRIMPISLKEANEYVFTYHRHHKPCIGQKFSVSVRDDYGMIHGVAICGRPVSRYLDDGLTLEINRCCTDGTRNACSMLYSACVRAAKAMGYTTVITYTLESEDGASLKASNFTFDGIAGGKMWTGKRSGRDNGVPQEMKKAVGIQNQSLAQSTSGFSGVQGLMYRAGENRRKSHCSASE